MTAICAVGFLASCGTSGADGCLTYGLLRPAPETVDWLVENDRRLAEGILAHNETWERLCR